MIITMTTMTMTCLLSYEDIVTSLLSLASERNENWQKINTSHRHCLVAVPDTQRRISMH